MKRIETKGNTSFVPPEVIVIHLYMDMLICQSSHTDVDVDPGTNESTWDEELTP